MEIEAKVLEVRDKGTNIPVLAIKMKANNKLEDYYLHYRCGYPPEGSGIVLMKLYDQKANSDPYAWDDRTMLRAHFHIYSHFSLLKDGDVVDVQFLIGETKEPKTSERFSDTYFKGKSKTEENRHAPTCSAVAVDMSDMGPCDCGLEWEGERRHD